MARTRIFWGRAFGILALTCWFIAGVAPYKLFAQDQPVVEAALPVAGTTLRAGRDIETLSGSQIPAGANVEVLGLVSVAPDVAASGYLLNFRYRSSVYVADLGQFLSESSDPVYYLSGAYSRDTGSGAEVCATLLSSKGVNWPGLKPN